MPQSVEATHAALLDLIINRRYREPVEVTAAIRDLIKAARREGHDLARRGLPPDHNDRHRLALDPR
jgi:hypothetical protein